MKKLFLLLYVLSIISYGFAQKKSLEIALESKDGNFIRQDADVYSMGPFKIIGLKTNADYAAFEKSMKKQPIVKKFEYVAPDNSDGTKNAVVSFSTNDENAIQNLFKSLNILKVTVNDRTFTIDQKEELKAYLQEISNKHAEKQQLQQNERRAMPFKRVQTNE